MALGHLQDKHICIQIVLLEGFFKNKYFGARTPKTSITEKSEGEKIYINHSYIHSASLVSEKNDYMSSQYFLRYVLGINSKKHANFMDEEPDISKN